MYRGSSKTSHTRALTESADCADKLRVLSDTTRLAILRVLLRKALSVGDINAHLHIDQSLLSHHLRTLREAGFVQSERDGKLVVYSLAPAMRVRSTRAGLQLGCCAISFA